MSAPKRIVIISGEASGDLYAAKFVEDYLKKHPDAKFSGLGGERMQQAGVDIHIDLAQYGVVGVWEVLKFSRILRKAYKLIQAKLIEDKPDCLILVDYPGFNLRMAKFAKSLNIPVIYYISPQIWAWKASRIEAIKKTVTMMAVILPFETAIYNKAQAPAVFVGHPLCQIVKPTLDKATFLAMHQLPSTRLIGLMPGSRQHEIDNLLPVMLRAAKQIHQRFPDTHFVLPTALTVNQSQVKSIVQASDLPVTIIQNQTYDAINACHCVIVTSGTATLETMLLQKPMVIIYKTHWLTYCIARIVVNIDFIGLPNLLANKAVVPELIQAEASPENIAEKILHYLDNPENHQETVKALQCLSMSLANTAADTQLLTVVEKAKNSLHYAPSSGGTAG